MPEDSKRARPWVDLDRGTVSREIFASDEVYQIELEQIFARTWLFVGHESQVPDAGERRGQ